MTDEGKAKAQLTASNEACRYRISIHNSQHQDFSKNCRARANSVQGKSWRREILLDFHKHEGDFELYYGLEGEGLLNDNGLETTAGKGNVVRTGHGESHSIKSFGDKDLELIAIILFE